MPLLITVAKIETIGINVETAPIATIELTSASFAAIWPRVTNLYPAVAIM
ncbi:unannotated protein [freshwater metagenome]|uniref:Unannotated protein n=1 Tax=freshwater metagenome TaxID=449393 RepID=A0A6J6HN17_9ZZZZ